MLYEKNRKHLYIIIILEVLLFITIIYFAFFEKMRPNIYDDWKRFLQKFSETIVQENNFKEAILIKPSDLETARKSEVLFFSIKNKTPQSDLAYKFFLQAENLRRVSSFHEAIVFYKKAKILFVSLKEYKAVIACFIGIGEIYRLLDDKLNACKNFEESLEYEKRSFDYYFRARALKGLGQTEANTSKGKHYLDKAYALFKFIHNIPGMASVLKIYGDMDRHRGLFESSKQNYDKSISLYRDIHDRFGEADCLRGLGHLLLSVGDYKAAQQYYQTSLNIFNDLGHMRQKAKVLRGLGDRAVYMHQFDEALKSYQEALALFKEYEDRKGEGEVLHGMGILYRVKEDLDVSLDYLNKALKIFETYREPIWIHYTQLERAITFYKKKQYSQSLSIAKTIFKEPFNDDNKLIQARTYLLLARISKSLEKFKESLNYIDKALHCYESIHNPHGVALALMLRSSIHYYYTNNFPFALKEAQEAYSIFKELNNEYQQSSALRRMADVERLSVSYENAFLHYEEATRFLKINDYKKRGKILFGMGQLEDKIGHYDKALKYYNEAIQYASKGLNGKKILYRSLTGLAESYSSTKQIEKSKKLLEESYHGCQREQDTLGSVIALRQRARIAYREGEIEQAKQMIGKVLSLLSQTESCRLQRARSLCFLSKILFFQGSITESIQALKESIEICAQLGTFRSQAQALLRLARFESLLGRYNECSRTLDKAKALMPKVNKPLYMMKIYIRAGEMHFEQGNLEETLDYYKKIKIFLQQTSDINTLYRYKIAMGEFFQSVGDYVESKKLLEEALKIAEENKHIIHQIEVYPSLIRVLIKLNLFEKAKKMIVFLKGFSGESKRLSGKIFMLEGYLMIKQNHVEEAKIFYKKAMRVFYEINDYKMQVNLLCDLGDACMLSNHYNDAQNYYERAAKASLSFLGFYDQAYTLYKLGYLSIRQGQLSSAENYLEQSYKYATQINHSILQIRSLHQLSIITKDEKSEHFKKKAKALLKILGSLEQVDLRNLESQKDSISFSM